jgi:hypothetical protein
MSATGEGEVAASLPAQRDLPAQSALQTHLRPPSRRLKRCPHWLEAGARSCAAQRRLLLAGPLVPAAAPPSHAAACRALPPVPPRAPTLQAHVACGQANGHSMR